MPLEKTLLCCDSLEGRDGKCDIFCKQEGDADVQNCTTFEALQWRNCLGSLRGYTDPILYRMIVMPLEKTLAQGDLIKGRNGKCDIFCKQEDGFIDRSKLCLLHRPRLEPCNGGIV